MIHKRGFTKIIVFGIVAVLVILSFFVLITRGDYIGKFQELLPGFNNTREIIEEEVILRYDIQQENVQIRQGTAWIDVNEPEAGRLEEIFQLYFAQQRDFSKEMTLGLNSLNELYASRFNKNELSLMPIVFNMNIISIPKGEVNIRLNNANTGNQKDKNVNYGEFFLDLEDNLYFRPIKSIEEKDGIIITDIIGSDRIKISESDLTISPYLHIRRKAIDWRDSVLEKPISLSYDGRFGNHVVERLGNFLIVRV